MADGRSTWSRLFSDIYADLVAHCGGELIISEPRRLLARRCALLEVEMVCIETSLAELRGNGDMRMLAKKLTMEWLSSYATLLKAQRRCLEALGLNRAARPIQNLSQYIEATYGGDDKARTKVEDLEVVE